MSVFTYFVFTNVPKDSEYMNKYISNEFGEFKYISTIPQDNMCM